MKDLSEPNITTYHYEYDANGNRTTVEIKDDGLTLESTVYTYDRLNKLVSSREVTASGLYIYEYTYDDNGNLVQEDRHRQFEAQRTNIRRYEYTKDNKLESVYSGNTLLVSYTYDGDGTITSSLERDLDLNQNLNINDNSYLNRLTANQRQLINKVSSNDSFLYELTEYITDKNRPYSETLMERDGTGQLSTIYTYGNQRINSESYNNLSGLYTYDGRGSVSVVIGTWGDFRASYWYDGLGNVKSQIHGYGAFGSGKKYYGYNAEQYNPVTGNQNLRNRQLNIRRQRFLTEDTYLGNNTDTLSINRYIYGNANPLKYKDPSGNIVITGTVLLIGVGILGAGAIVTTQVIAKNNVNISNRISSEISNGIEILKWNALNKAIVTANTAISVYSVISDAISSLTIVTPRIINDYPVANDSEIRRITDETYTNSIYAATNTAYNLSSSKGCEKDKVQQNDEDNSDTTDNKTKISKGKQRPPKKSDPNSIYEQLNDDGTVKTRSFYDENGNQFDRQDFDHSHYSKDLHKDLTDGHEHIKSYNERGQVNGKDLIPLPDGYSNLPSN